MALKPKLSTWYFTYCRYPKSYLATYLQATHKPTNILHFSFVQEIPLSLSLQSELYLRSCPGLYDTPVILPTKQKVDITWALHSPHFRNV